MFGYSQYKNDYKEIPMKCHLSALYLIFFFLAIGQFPILAQVPFIKSLSKTSAKAQETLSIQGVNFGTNKTNIKVMFGGVSSVPQTISDQLIEANVPFGATYEDISVINTSTGLMGYSKNPFLQSYGGTNPFNISQLSAQFDFDSESDLYDLTIADFDGDGKQDIATANKNSPNISVFLNTSTPGTVSFTKTLLSPGVQTLHVTSGDLNGDGKPEILVGENNGSRVFIFKNSSTVGSLSFALQSITVVGGKVSQIKILDLDLNGHPELVVSDQSASRVFVIANQSTLATIQFAAATGITLPSTVVMDGVALGDLDGDGLPEVAVGEFQGKKVFVLKNKSVPGTLNLVNSLELPAANGVVNMCIGDLDGDTKPEIAATQLLGSGVVIFQNQSTTSGLQFSALPIIDTNLQPWGIDFGDLDGDGKTDIVVASITQKMVTLLNNQSTPGNLSFSTKQTIPTTYANRHVRVSDVDGDGRPDLNFTSIDFLGVPASKVSVILNKNCVIPTLTPNGPLTVCSGLTPHQLLTASSNPGATYEWFKDAVSLGAPSSASTLDVNVNGSGTYTVKLVNGTCSNTSAGVSVTVITNSASPVTPPPVPPVCLGGVLTLTIPASAGATDYVWTGPGSYSANGTTVTRPNFKDVDAGVYDVDVMVGTCVTQRQSVVVDVVNVPNAEVIFSGSAVICQGQTKLFSIFPTVTGYSYQWAEQTTGDIAGATSSTYTATVTGDYFVKLKSTINSACAPIPSASKKIKIAAIPFVDFTSPTSACVGQSVTFTDQTIMDSDTVGLHVKYLWDFGDATTSTGPNPTHTYTTAQTFSVNHTVSYINNSCPASKAKSLPVKNPPALAITNPENVFSVCPSDSLLLAAPTGFDTYLWSTGDKTSSIYVKQAGNYSVDVTSGVCKLTDDQAVGQFAAPTVTASADPTSIKVGTTSQLSASGLTSYLWKPNKSGLSDSLIANPVASPVVSTTYAVSGKDANGCTGNATVDILVIQNSTLDSVHPTNFFSPNGDSVNDFWQVENAPSFSQCGVTIYDEKGMRVFQAKPYLNDWNGISSGGKVLPAGVYYYVMKCDDSGSNYLAGSINIVR